MKSINGWYLLVGALLVGAISASEKEIQKPLACILTIYIVYVLIKLSR